MFPVRGSCSFQTFSNINYAVLKELIHISNLTAAMLLGHAEYVVTCVGDPNETSSAQCHQRESRTYAARRASTRLVRKGNWRLL